MDRLSQGQSKDDALSQSPSACSLPTAFDLSRRSRHSPGSPAPTSGLRLARAPVWRDISSRGVEPPGNSSPPYRNSLSAQQVQPDNAFSNTTVTLSYSNRSHVHSAQDQTAPSVRSVPSRAGGQSLRSPPDSVGRRLVSSTGRDGGVCRGQAANRQVGELASRSEHLRAYLEAPAAGRPKGGQGGVARITQHAPGFNGKHELLAPGGASRPQRRPSDGVAEAGNRFSQRREGDQRRGTANGVKEDFWDLDLEPFLGKYSPSFRPKVEQRQSGGEASADRSKRTSRKLYSSLNEDFMSSLDFMGPLFPAESSADEMEDLGTPPQALDSPGSDSPCPEEEPVDVAEVKSKDGEGCKFTVQFVEVSSSPEDSSSDDSDVIEVPVTNRVASLPAGLPQQPFRKSPAPPERLSERKQLTRAVMKTERTVPGERLNGNTLGEGRAVGKIKTPPREILAALRRKAVVNLTPLRPKAFGHARSVEQRAQPQFTADRCAVLRGGASDGDSACDSEAKAPKRTKQPPPQKSGAKPSTTTSASGKPKKKRKRAGQPSAFCPREPEIKLKYATFRDEKRDARGVDFAPYVHLEEKEFSRCTVVNYLEEETGGLKKGRPRPAGSGMVPGAVPATSCLEPGRLDAEGRQRTDRKCCLCGDSADRVVDLGDLHGPYRPRKGPEQGGPAGGGAPAEPREEGPKDGGGEACSDSDSSSYDGRREKRGRVREQVEEEEEEGRGAQPLGTSHGSKQQEAATAVLAAESRWFCEEDGRQESLRGRSAKTPWPASDGNGNRRSAPAVALDSGEFWLHEDCAVWSTGVFLVRGRLYGLEEAVRLAQGTVCSTCHEEGATLGCFFKGCPNKYHYRCALLSDCVLNEENFTMKCTKHKNKPLKGLSRAENS